MKRSFFNIVFFYCLTSQVSGQIATYNFESDLLDEVAIHHAEYLDYGLSSSNTPNYNAGETGMNILLDKTEGLMFPSSLNAKFDVESSIELSFDFRMEDIGEKEGFLYVMSNQPGVNGKGWSIFARHDIFSDIPNYDLVFTYADGGFEAGVPNHPGHNETLLGNFIQGEWVNIKLILDFEKNNWSAIVNGNYTSAFFNEEYDIDLIKESFTNNDLFLAWSLFREQDLEYDSSGFANAASFDQLAFYSPKKAGDASVLSSALQAMIDHVNGGMLLTEDELKDNLIAIQLNYEGNFDASKDKIYDYITAYEMGNEPLFQDRFIVDFTSLSVEEQVILFLQQDIFDTQFTSGNIANVEGIKFEAAEIFPGQVAEFAPRLNDQVVEVYGTYSSIQGARVAADLNDAKRPTGFYLAPGDIVNITIPSALINSGLTVMVGAHDSDHSVVGVSNRFRRISKSYALDSEMTPIANPFGGGIYIKVPEGTDLGWFDVKIDGAVKSPYFSTRTDRMTSPSDWKIDIDNKHVPWADIEGDKFMTTLPLNEVEDLEDPTLLMSYWDNIMDGYRYVGGRPYFRARAEYFLVDSRLPSGAYGTGYPQVIGEGDYELYPTNVLNPEFYKTGFAITLHEYGHLAAHPTLAREVESIVHLNASYIYNEYFGLPIDSSFKYSAFEKLTMDQTAMDWMIAFNFRNNNDMSCDPTMEELVCDEIRYQHRGHAKYVQMAMLFGWETVFEMNQVFYDRWKAEFDNNKVVTADEMIEFSSNAAGVNMAPLMHFWGLQPSDGLAAELQSMPQSSEILESLIYYKSIIPQDKEAFQDWYDILRARKGEPHFNRYDRSLDEFDSETYASDMRAQIDFLIATYFPALSSEASVITFNLPNQIGETIVDTTNNTIKLTAANGSDLSNLVATYSISMNATARVNGVLQESGVTANDFTNPLVYQLTAEDGASITEYTVTVLEDMPSNAYDFEGNQVLIYPNPVMDKLHIDINKGYGSDVGIEVIDPFGRKVDQYKMIGSTSAILDLSDYLPGIYFGILQVDDRNLLIKFIKK